MADGQDLDRLAGALASTRLFDGLPDHALRALAARCREVTLPSGAVLLEEGAGGGSLYVVLEGRLRATMRGSDGGETLLGEAWEGEFVGEGALVAGTPHMATVAAVTEARLLELPGDALAAEPAVREALAGTLEHRLRWARTRRLRPGADELARILTGTIGDLDPEVVAALEPELRWETLPRGARLMTQGEPGECAYLVVSGRLRVFGEREDGTTVEIAEVGPGEPIGEMALLADERRSASAEALRDTELVALPRAGFERLVEAQPKALAFFTRMVVVRLGRVVRGRAPVVQLGVGPTVTQADCEDVVRTENLVLRNLRITQTYHRLSQELTLLLGHADANWCTFACSASKTAGYSIRGEDVHPLSFLGPQRRARRRPRAVRLQRIQELVTATVSAGNLKVFAELGPVFAEMIRTFHRDERYDPDKLARFLAPLDRGPTEGGGQDTLVEALTHYYEAMFEPEPKRKAELIMLGNVKVGLHEQIRLQPNILEALNAPVELGLTDSLLQRAAGQVVRIAPQTVEDAIRRRGGALERVLLGSTASTWRRIVTRNVMTIRLPYGELRLGDDVPELPTATMFPDVLQTLEHPELVRVVERYAGSADGAARRAADWGRLEDRMRFIVVLFRSRQRSLELFAQPFLYEQLLEIAAGRVPSGDL